MVGTVAAGVEQLGAVLDSLRDADLDALTSRELVDLLQGLERHRRRLAAVDVRLVAQLRDRQVAAEYCRTSVADLLIDQLRIGPGEARARVLAAEDLGPRVALSGETLEPVLPRVAAALEAGEISPAHLAVIGKTLDRLPAQIAHEVFPVAEQFLTDAARAEQPRALEKTAALLLARLDPDGPAPHDGNPTRREFTLTRHATGWSTPRGSLDPATTAALTAVLDPLAAPAPAPADENTLDTRTPDTRTAAQRRHDALYEIARRLLRSGDLPAAGGVPTTVVVTTKAGSDRATGPRGEILTLHHLLPCEHLACEAELVAITVSATGSPLQLGRTRRLASLAQRLALAARDGGCCFPGCGRPAAWAEAHHIRAWSDGGDTDIDNLCLLCAYHHREFGRRGWQVRLAADGHPEWLPPPHVDAHRKPVRNHAHHPTELTFTDPD